ncbi:alpha/beta-tubulin-N-acetyltransferase 9 isoform X1 [Lissotriton helveticus]
MPGATSNLWILFVKKPPIEEAMKINQDTLLQGHLATLVPYSPEHVPRYHEWMKSEELQRLTASEPLTLEQEFEMQRSWRDDNDKCTFIVLDGKKWSDTACADEDCMVGDVNLFLTNPEDPTLGEIEVMIAAVFILLNVRSSFLSRFYLPTLLESSYRGKGFGKEATLLMLRYGVTSLGISKFEAKIGQENVASIALFQKLRFQEVSVSSVFQEVTFRLIMTAQEQQWLLGQTDYVLEKSYSETQRLTSVN